jgi:hypothetical protein
VESTTVGSAPSIRQLLAPSAQVAKDHVNDHLDAAVKLQVGIPREKVIEAILGLFDIPLADILLPAWEQYSDVREAMHKTRKQPGTVRQVRVAGHTFKSEHHPTLECDLDEVKIFELELDLDLELHFAGVVLTIARGEIISIGPGDATVTASLSTAKGVPLIPEQQLIVVFSHPFTRRAPTPRTTLEPLPLPLGQAERN